MTKKACHGLDSPLEWPTYNPLSVSDLRRSDKPLPKSLAAEYSAPVVRILLSFSLVNLSGALLRPMTP